MTLLYDVKVWDDGFEDEPVYDVKRVTAERVMDIINDFLSRWTIENLVVYKHDLDRIQSPLGRVNDNGL